MRFLIDPGSGTCLWREPGASEAHFEYAIDHRVVGLSRNTVTALDALIALADLQIDWAEPTSNGPHWTKELEAQLKVLQASTLKAAAAELDSLGFALSHE
jgi:hypothetical protein